MRRSWQWWHRFKTCIFPTTPSSKCCERVCRSSAAGHAPGIRPTPLPAMEVGVCPYPLAERLPFTQTCPDMTVIRQLTVPSQSTSKNMAFTRKAKLRQNIRRYGRYSHWKRKAGRLLPETETILGRYCGLGGLELDPQPLPDNPRMPYIWTKIRPRVVSHDSGVTQAGP